MSLSKEIKPSLWVCVGVCVFEGYLNENSEQFLWWKMFGKGRPITKKPWKAIGEGFFVTFKADQSDLLQLVEPVSNSSRIPIGVSGDVGWTSLASGEPHRRSSC